MKWYLSSRIYNPNLNQCQKIQIASTPRLPLMQDDLAIQPLLVYTCLKISALGGTTKLKRRHHGGVI